jgi:hypothetical protein
VVFVVWLAAVGGASVTGVGLDHLLMVWQGILSLLC